MTHGQREEEIKIEQHNVYYIIDQLEALRSSVLHPTVDVKALDPRVYMTTC